MKCQRCESERVLFIGNSTNSDMGTWSYKDTERECCTLPYIDGVCGGDAVAMTFCLDCGQIQGKFPNKWEPEDE